MSLSRFAILAALAGVLLAGCAKPPASRAELAADITGSTARAYVPLTRQPLPDRLFSPGHLAGRTMAVASTADIMLQRGEVILTFDDGPRPGRTDAILDTLDQYGVKATFLMLGSAADAHPALVRAVAAHGHSIGSHSYDHANLSTITSQAALDDILRGEQAISHALEGSGQTMAPFFRFPYLAQTGFLRTNMKQTHMVVLDVNIDSKDYYTDTPADVVARTLQRLDARGSGIILFHDIHARTVALLPDFLTQLQERGYSVVQLVPRDPGVFGRDIITAQAPVELRGTL